MQQQPNLELTDLADFFDFFGEYEVPYMGRVFTIKDQELGRINLESSEHTLLFHMKDIPVHVVKGMIGEMVRHYAHMIALQKEAIKEFEDAVYRRLKVRTMGQLFPNSARNANESSKAPSDTFAKKCLTDNMEAKNGYLEPREDIARYQQALKELKPLEEIYGRLQNSFQIVSDTYKTALSINANERERDKAQFFANKVG